MIELEDICVDFNPGTPMRVRALDHLSLTIPAGQFVTVIGSNGAGKSTLLGAMAGESPLKGGRVLIENQDITSWPVHRRATLVARIFQDPMAGSCAALTIGENLALAMGRGSRRSLALAASRADRQRFKELLAGLGLGLESRLDERMELLSGGQRQAVSLLMATLKPMKILLLDEHTAALDPKTAAMVLELTKRIVGEQSLTTLMVTHSMKQALEVGERTIMLHQGRIILDIDGEKRKDMGVKDLLDMFEQKQGESLSDDSALG